MLEAAVPRKTERSLLEVTPNRWDWALLPLVLSVLVAVGFGAMQMGRPLSLIHI